MDVSIIIPCYNSGKYLPDALESVRALDCLEKYEIEAIIIDDGSTDPATAAVLAQINDPMVQVLHRENGGPAAARNTGVAQATGKYLVFLDADNRLKPDFISECLTHLEATNANIVFGKPEFFGESTAARFTTGPFNLHKIIVENYIDICVLISREDFERVGGMDEERSIIGFEDWEFHLRAYSAGLKFHFIDKVLYQYRIIGNSLSQTHSLDRINHVKKYVYQKNLGLILESLSYYRECERIRQRDMDNKFRFLLKIIYRWIRPVR